jgi:hypothetical protein
MNLLRNNSDFLAWSKTNGISDAEEPQSYPVLAFMEVQNFGSSAINVTPCYITFDQLGDLVDDMLTAIK